MLAVIIVSWNTRRLTLDTIRTLQHDIGEHGPVGTQIWVVDNASVDGTVVAIRTEFPAVHVIENPQNVGFGVANNIAMRTLGFGASAQAELPSAVYLLNSDTRTQPGATRALYDALFRLPDAGVVGARLTYDDGRFQHSAFAFPGLAQLWMDVLPTPNRLRESALNGRYPLSRYQGQQPFRVGHTLGATMMLRGEVIQQVGMFDESFFMYAEEVDWSWRIQKAGWQIYCVPTAHVIHLAGQSTRLVKPQSILNLWKSRYRLYQKHYPRWKFVLAKRVVQCGMRYKIWQTGQQYARQAISAQEREQLIQVYRQVASL